MCQFLFNISLKYARWITGLVESVENTFFNLSPPGKIDRHVADDIVHCIFMNETFCILIQISLMFDPDFSVDNKTVLVQVMA